MIEWDDKLRTTTFMKKRVNEVKKALNSGNLQLALCYCITTPTNSQNQLDIYNMSELLFRYYRESDITLKIVGLAESKPAAIGLVADMVRDSIAATGSADIKGYLNAYSITDT